MSEWVGHAPVARFRRECLPISKTQPAFEPWHGCHKSGNDQGKKFFKVREFYFKSGEN